MNTLAPGYGKQVSELACNLEGYGPSILHHVDTTELDRLQRAVDNTAHHIRVAERELRLVNVDRHRLEAECHGYKRTLEMVSLSHSTDDAMNLRIMQRIVDRSEQFEDLTVDAAFLQTRMKTLSADLRGNHTAAIEALEVCISRAADTKRRESVRHRRSELERAAAVVVSDTDPMWSPVALIGYRAWNMRPDGMYGAWKRWKAPQLSATCRKGDGVPHANGQCGSIAFGCGIYAAKDPTRLMRAYGLGPSASVAIGVVTLEGRVVEHEKGYRAEQVRVVALVTVDEDDIRIIEDSDELANVFDDPNARTRLGDKIDVPSGDVNGFRKTISKHLKEREPGGTLWT